jgi:hypothetical protein
MDDTLTPNKPASTNKIPIKTVADSAKTQLQELTGFGVSSVVSVKVEQEGWKVELELLEKEGIPDRMDMLGTYEVHMDSQGNLLSYERTGIRKRGDLLVQETEETE